jgi:hypothetical protein
VLDSTKCQQNCGEVDIRPSDDEACLLYCIGPISTPQDTRKRRLPMDHLSKTITVSFTPLRVHGMIRCGGRLELGRPCRRSCKGPLLDPHDRMNRSFTLGNVDRPVARESQVAHIVAFGSSSLESMDRIPRMKMPENSDQEGRSPCSMVQQTSLPSAGALIRYAPLSLCLGLYTLRRVTCRGSLCLCA